MVIASDWFESLSVKKQKEYIAEHPESKFAHKVGKGHVNPKVTKSKHAQMQHLEEEGLDDRAGYFGLSTKERNLVDTVADKSGTRGTGSGKPAGRTLFDNTSNLKDKKEALRKEMHKLLEQQSELTSKMRAAYKTPAYDKLEVQYNKLMDKLQKNRDTIQALKNK